MNEPHIADAIRKVVATMAKAVDDGQRSSAIDAEDLMDVLLSIADAIDSPH